MKFKLHWGKAKVFKRFQSPLQETDYEGNDLWGRAFPKPRPLTDYEGYLAQAMRNSFNKAVYRQSMAAKQYVAPCGSYMLGGLGGQL